MPYSMRKVEGKYCVFNKETGENKGCSKSRSMATAHMRALYAVEGGAKMGKKDLDELMLKEWNEFVTEHPDEDQTIAEEFYGLFKGHNDEDDLVLRDEDEENCLNCDEDEGEDDEKAISKREDVSDADKKRAVGEYGNVTYADAKNKKYPVDTEEHIRAAWSYINMPKNQAKYSSGEVSSIKRKIVSAWRSKIDKKGPPQAKKSIKERVFEFFNDLFDDGEEDAPIEETEEKSTEDFMLWKEKDGLLHWIGRYSNNFIDDDNKPGPEIISEASHLRFVDLVDRKEIEPPVLQIWHIPEYEFGKADWVAYDDTGFAIAGGTIHQGCEDVAEWISEQKGVRMSHGMPTSSIKRDPANPHVIVEHITEEVSVLPLSAAANKFTGFNLIETTQKEGEMPIPQNKVEALKSDWRMSDDLIAKLEQRNALDAQKATEEGREQKEIAEETQAVVATETQEVVAEPAAEEVAQTEVQYATRDEIAEAFANVIKPYLDRQDEIMARLEGVEKSLKETQMSEEERVVKTIAETPSASVAALIARRLSAVGSDETRLRTNSPLVEKKPKEAETVDHRTGIPFIDEMLSAK